MSANKTQRKDHALWVQLMVLTAHHGICVYCGKERADTLDHEEPVAHGGADVWWNFMPACKACNLWKNGRTAAMWKRDMDLKHTWPKAFSGRAMAPEVYQGIPGRVEKARRELSDQARRNWFRHHYGSRPKPRGKEELRRWVTACRHDLKRYPSLPWTYPEAEGAKGDVCTRRICCEYRHPDMRPQFVALTDKERLELGRRAKHEGLHEGDLLGKIIRQYLGSEAVDQR